MLLKNSCKVSLCNIISKGTVAKNTGCLTCRIKLLMPGNNALRERLNLIPRDKRGKADEQNAPADRVNLFTGKPPFLDRNTKVKAKLEEQLIKNIRFGAISLQVLY